MNVHDKPLVWLHGEVQSPPFSRTARLEAGFLLRKLQRGDTVLMPHARPMPSIGPRCYELRVHDTNKTWRIIYRIDLDAIVICEVFEKKTPKYLDTYFCTFLLSHSQQYQWETLAQNIREFLSRYLEPPKALLMSASNA